MSKVLVTGGMGDVGTALLVELRRAGHSVRCLDRKTRLNMLNAARLRRKGIQVQWCDVRRPADVERSIAGQDAVIHLAAILPPRSEIDPVRARSVTVEGTRNVVNAVRSQPVQPRLVYVSSLAVFGRTDDRPPPRTATDPVQPFDHYTHHKVEAESIVRTSGVPWCIRRLGVVVPIGRFTREPRLLLREMFEVPLDQRIECVHVEDVARALTKALDCDEALCQTLLIGGGPKCQISHREFVERTLEEVGIGALPAEAYGTVPYHTDWLDTAESERLLHYQRHTFEDFLLETRRSVGPWRMAILMLRPLVRWIMLRQSAYLP
jgi:nucleoside-diphosphate-sugar epimerase